MYDADLSISTNELIKFDHFPIIFDLPWEVLTCNVEEQTPVFKQYRKLKQINQDAFKSTLRDEFGNTLLDHQNSSFPQYLEMYNQCLSSALDHHAPVQTKLFSNQQLERRDPEWMDEEYKSERRIRRKLERNSKRLQTPESKRLCVEQRDRCITMANNKMCSFYRNLISSTDNQNVLFKTVSRLWGKNKPKQLPDCDGDFTKLANQFNHYFSDKIAKIRESFSTFATGIYH